MNTRNKYSRWEYPEDRFDYYRWFKSKRPADQVDWHEDERGTLVLKLRKAARRLWFNIPSLELRANTLGWRSCVAAGIKECRRALRQ